MTWKGSRGWTAALALIAGMGIALVAAPAEAKDEFEDGFKSELGRIAAHKAVYAGRYILGAVIYGDPYAHADHREYERHHRYDDDHHHDRYRHHWSRVHYRKHYYKHRDYRHGRRHKHYYDHDPHQDDHGWHYHGGNRCNVQHVETHVYVYD